MIVVEQLSKTYWPGQAPALDNVSLRISDGAIYGILGRSGAGKSTLLRCINLLERPSSGRILLDGEDLTTLSDLHLLATPVLKELVQQQGVELNLLASGVESVGGRRVGRLRMAFRQPGDEPNLTRVVDFLKRRGVRVERS